MLRAADGVLRQPCIADSNAVAHRCSDGTRSRSGHGLLAAIEPLRVQTLIAKPPIAALIGAVLAGLARLTPLKGALGDGLPGVLCRAGHNIRRLLKALRLLFTFIVWAITGHRAMNHGAHHLAV
jgi:hypothetical protein